MNICFDSNSTFVNNEIFGTISYSSEKVNPLNDIFGMGVGTNSLVFGFGISKYAEILNHSSPESIKATQYANMNSVYYTDKKL